MPDPFFPVSNAEGLLYAVKRLEVQTSAELSVGTGCLFSLPLEDGHKVFLLTNKHVLDGARCIRILMHTADADGKPDGRYVFLELKPANAFINGHDDPDVDLSSIEITDAMVKWMAANPGQMLYYRALERENVWAEDAISKLDVCEPITMVGYPNGIWDETNGFPLFRRGVTASHPVVRFNGKPQFVVDIGAFGGSSGSPILVIDAGLQLPKGEPALKVMWRFGLIGTLWGGPIVTKQGEVQIVPAPTNSRLVVQTEHMLHLGYAVSASETLALMDKLERIVANVRSNAQA